MNLIMMIHTDGPQVLLKAFLCSQFCKRKDHKLAPGTLTILDQLCNSDQPFLLGHYKLCKIKLTFYHMGERLILQRFKLKAFPPLTPLQKYTVFVIPSGKLQKASLFLVFDYDFLTFVQKVASVSCRLSSKIEKFFPQVSRTLANNLLLKSPKFYTSVEFILILLLNFYNYSSLLPVWYSISQFLLIHALKSWCYFKIVKIIIDLLFI